MARNCKYPDKPCKDRYLKSRDMKLKCRLDEWKKKLKSCPYDIRIRSKSTRPKGQLSLNERYIEDENYDPNNRG